MLMLVGDVPLLDSILEDLKGLRLGAIYSIPAGCCSDFSGLHDLDIFTLVSMGIIRDDRDVGKPICHIETCMLVS